LKYKNPIISGFYPDPSITRVGEDYYLVTSSFAYFPGVPIFHSKDLISWEQIGYCLSRKSQLTLEKANISGGIYAPTIRYYDGTFYMVTTNVSDKGNFYVTSKDPRKEWSEPIYVEQGGIDPSLLFDGDKVYFTSTGEVNGISSILQSEIDIVTGKILREIECIWSGTGGRFPEAPHLYKINDIYYLMISEGGTEYGHMITIGRSTSPWGPFTSNPLNPILTHRNLGNSIIQGTGHGDLVEAADGNWWIVFLAFRTSTQYFHHLGRETYLAPVKFNEDGWPVINDNGTVAIEMKGPLPKPYPYISIEIRDDFNTNSLRLCWNFICNPFKENWSLEAKASNLTLYGNPVTLSHIGSPAFVGRRQQHFNCHFKSKLEFYPKNNKDEAGITIFYDYNHHYEIGLVKIHDSKYIIVRKTIGDLSTIVYKESYIKDTIIFDITSDPLHYTLSYGEDEETLNFASSALTQYVSTEATKCSFTGVYLGMYASSSGTHISTPAYFDWFDYEGMKD